MAEKIVFTLMMWDKTLTNPINKSEVFNCKDIYAEYRKCNVFRKKGLATADECRDIRYLGMRCFSYSEESFMKYLAKTFEEKRQYLEYLKSHKSLLYDLYKEDPSFFNVFKYQEQENTEGEDINEFVLKKLQDKDNL